MNNFTEDIKKFNEIYKLPIAPFPTLDAVGDAIKRMQDFKNILAEELNEIDEIIQNAQEKNLSNEEVLVNLADLLGDIIVYCASEMAKFGLPFNEVLNVIMQSNFSKLGVDGFPIYDGRGKVMKGPNYFKPEPAIRELLIKMMQNSSAFRGL